MPTPSQDGISITFREFGILLKFQPVVQAGQMIRLKITYEVSEPDFTNAVQIAGLIIPGLSIRTSTTAIEVGSGQTFAIAGLLSDNLRGVRYEIRGQLAQRAYDMERQGSEIISLNIGNWSRHLP